MKPLQTFPCSRAQTDPGTAREGAAVPGLGRLLPPEQEEECPWEGFLPGHLPQQDVLYVELGFEGGAKPSACL